MTRVFRNMQDVWRDYRFVHTVASRLAGLGLLAFCCFCFYEIYQRAEPTTVALALLTFMSACGIFLTAGQKGLEAWTHRNDPNYQPSQQTSYAPSPAAPAPSPASTDDGGDPPVNPASQDGAGDGEEDK